MTNRKIDKGNEYTSHEKDEWISLKNVILLEITDVSLKQ